MAEQKSKLPDINEIASMAKKLFGDVQTSIRQIIEDYKSKHASPESSSMKPPVSPDVSVHPVEPRPTDPVEPQPIRPIEPEPVKPVEPQPIRPIEPEPIQPVEPEPVQPTEPEPINPIEPEIGETHIPPMPVDADIKPKASKAKVKNIDKE